MTHGFCDSKTKKIKKETKKNKEKNDKKKIVLSC